MHPDTKYWEKTQNWYPDASLQVCNIPDDRVRGRKLVMIGDEFAGFCQEFLVALREAVGLQDKPVCKDNEVYDVKDAAKFSIVGHHNVSAKKWDVIPWAEKLYHNID